MQGHLWLRWPCRATPGNSVHSRCNPQVSKHSLNPFHKLDPVLYRSHKDPAGVISLSAQIRIATHPGNPQPWSRRKIGPSQLRLHSSTGFFYRAWRENWRRAANVVELEEDISEKRKANKEKEKRTEMKEKMSEKRRIIVVDDKAESWWVYKSDGRKKAQRLVAKAWEEKRKTI